MGLLSGKVPGTSIIIARSRLSNRERQVVRKIHRETRKNFPENRRKNEGKGEKAPFTQEEKACIMNLTVQLAWEVNMEQQIVVITLRGKQYLEDGKPEVIELVTEGTLETYKDGWKLKYEESDLTGLAGVTTTFFVEPSVVTLQRTGPLTSRMEFREGVPHESLYQMEFGALMLTVCANKVCYDITENGGTIDLLYSIEIEQTAAGQIEYHLDIKTK